MPGQDRARILVVENETLVAEHVTRVLEAGGFVVPGIAATGRDALRQIDQHQPDLIVMDIGLDGSMDGIEVGRALAASRPTPVVYLTAHCDEDTLRRAGLTNAAAYVVKPFTNQQLHSAVVMAVRQVRPAGASESDAGVLPWIGQGHLTIARTLQAMDAQAQSETLRETAARFAAASGWRW